VRQLLEYNHNTGKLYWKARDASWFEPCERLTVENKKNAWNARNAGREAFTASDGKGYKQGQVMKYHTMAHRVAWVVMNGEWPNHIDHINGLKDDNRAVNLRSVTRQENQRNLPAPVTNKSGVAGVVRRSRVGKLLGWEANIRVSNKQVYLGTFRCVTAAAIARKAAEVRYGYHENHGRAQGVR
jgi:hypothetical protein